MPMHRLYPLVAVLFAGLAATMLAAGPTIPAASPSHHHGSSSSAIIGYYIDWKASVYPPEMIPYASLTHLHYAFGVPSAEGNIQLDTPAILDRVVAGAHGSSVKVILSVGGWTGSRYLSPVSASPATRKTLVDNLAALVTKHNLDGIDLDWEYPGRAGMSCNVHSPADSANLLTLLTELRAALGPNKEISMATRVEPFDGPDGRPLSDLAAYTPVLDRVLIMAYDLVGAWSATSGSHAPLHGTGAMSVTGSIKAWTSAGWPAQNIAIGLPFYGRAFQLTANAGNALRANPTKISGIPIAHTPPSGDQDDALWAEPCPGAAATYSGIWQWRNLRAQNVLVSPAHAGTGWVSGIDADSATPWLYNAASNILVSYDDPDSLGRKIRAAKCLGVGGAMFWDLHQDNGELLSAVVSASSQGSGERC